MKFIMEKQLFWLLITVYLLFVIYYNFYELKPFYDIMVYPGTFKAS